MTRKLDKKFSYYLVLYYFLLFSISCYLVFVKIFFQIGVSSVRARVLADASIKVKIAFQNSNFPCCFEGVHCCSFPICVGDCLKVSIFSKKILGTNAIFCGYAKKTHN